MHKSTVTRKGQITIPAELRRDLGIEVGDEVTFLRIGDTLMLDKRPGSIVDRVDRVGRRYARIPPPDPSEEGREFESLVADQVWRSMQDDAVDRRSQG